jgi:hypothetical protein
MLGQKVHLRLQPNLIPKHLVFAQALKGFDPVRPVVWGHQNAVNSIPQNFTDNWQVGGYYRFAVRHILEDLERRHSLSDISTAALALYISEIGREYSELPFVL